MLKLISNPFNILIRNFIFIQPLLLLMLTVLTAMSYSIGGSRLSISNIILIFSMFLLAAAFFAGWFHINRLGVTTYNAEDTKEESTVKSVQNFKKFFEGVGGNFINVLISFILIAVIYTAVFYGIYKLISLSVGIPQFMYELPAVLNTGSQSELTAFLNGITDHDKIAFSILIIGLSTASAVLNYFSMVYFAVLTFAKENIFKTVWDTIKFIFSNILVSIFIIIFIEFLYLCLNIFAALTGANAFAFIIFLILFTIYLNYYLLLVFCFYYEKTKDNSSDGSNRLGENEISC